MRLLPYDLFSSVRPHCPKLLESPPRQNYHLGTNCSDTWVLGGRIFHAEAVNSTVGRELCVHLVAYYISLSRVTIMKYLGLGNLKGRFVSAPDSKGPRVKAHRMAFLMIDSKESEGVSHSKRQEMPMHRFWPFSLFLESLQYSSQSSTMMMSLPNANHSPKSQVYTPELN